MNTRANTFDQIRRLLALAGLAFFVVVANATAADNTKKAPKAAGETNSVAKQPPIEIPLSQFVIPTSAAEGRNPFFPDSLLTPKASASTTTNTIAKPPVAALDLKGISGTGTKRFALINGRTFETGEEGDVTVGRSKIRIHCITIREDSVTIEADGVRQELKLRPGI